MRSGIWSGTCSGGREDVGATPGHSPVPTASEAQIWVVSWPGGAARMTESLVEAICRRDEAAVQRLVAAGAALDEPVPERAPRTVWDPDAPKAGLRSTWPAGRGCPPPCGP
jgi:hypothetical protein